MSILSGIKKVIPYFKNADGNYEQLSYKTSSQTVEFDDGKTAETKLGTIKGITTSTSVTETGYAADAKIVSEINQSLVGLKEDFGAIIIKKVMTNTGTTIKITIDEPHSYCFIFGEANSDPFCYLVTNTSAVKINGYGSVEKSNKTYILNLKAYTRATIIMSSSNIGINC